MLTPRRANSPGRDRSSVGYMWPASLLRPASPPLLVYLDMNRWIELSKARSGHPDGQRHLACFDALMSARESGQVVFPLSDSVLMEVSRIGQHRQRRDLREVMEALSGFLVVTGRDVISTHEVEELLDHLVGPSPQPVNKMRYLDWGVARAFGKVGGFRVRRESDGADITGEVRAEFPGGPEAFDLVLANAELQLQRRVIDGPTPEEEPEIRALGWRPHGASEVSETRACQELEQVARFDEDPRWRRGRIRDVVAAREVIIEIHDILISGLNDRGATLSDVFDRSDESRGQFDAMPSFDVAVTLKSEYHRNGQHRWTTNDIHDIDALGSTLPYCDIVVTDKAVADKVLRTGLAERLGTTVLSSLAGLADRLSDG